MTMFLQQVLNGLVLGLEYGLFASGLALVFGSFRAMNFAYTSSFLLAAYILWGTSEVLHWPIFPIGIVLAILGGALISMITERLAFWPFRRKGEGDYHLSETIATVAVSMVVINIVILIFESDALSFKKTILPSIPIKLWGLSINPVQLIIFVVAALLMGILAWFLQKTKAGKAIRATAFRSSTARLLGINPEQIRIYTFIAAGALGGASGVLMTIFFGTVGLYLGDALMIKAFAMVIIGGVGSIRGSVLAGILLGLAETLSVAYLNSAFRDVSAYTLLFLILVIRPSGLFGKSEVTRA